MLVHGTAMELFQNFVSLTGAVGDNPMLVSAVGFILETETSPTAYCMRDQGVNVIGLPKITMALEKAKMISQLLRIPRNCQQIVRCQISNASS